MTTYFSPKIDKYLLGWICPSTWHTGHWCDDERFCQFVKSLDFYEYEQRLDESLLRKKILSAVQDYHDFNMEVANENIVNQVGDIRRILDFLEVTRNFPNAETEAWDPPEPAGVNKSNS